MKIAMLGAGALGSYFGGRLAAAGEDVVLIGRGAHLAAIRETGLRIESALGDADVRGVRTSEDPEEVGPVDAVLFLVKRYDTVEATRAMAPLVRPGTVVVTLQNGIDADRDILAAGCAGRVFPGAAYIPANIPRPGVVRHETDRCRLVFGARGADHPDELRELARRLSTHGTEAVVDDDVIAQLFEKFAFLSSFAALTALTRLPIGPILADGPASDLYFGALSESVAVALAAEPRLPSDLLERQTAMDRRLRPGVRASMLDDLERGKRIELDYLSGAVVRLGGDLGIPTPVHAACYAALHPHVNGAAGR